MKRRPSDTSRPESPMQPQPIQVIQNGHSTMPRAKRRAGVVTGADVQRVVAFLGEISLEIDASLDPSTPNPHLNILLHLLRCHLEGRLVSASSLVSVAGVPYATAVRKLADIQSAGLIEQRQRTKSGKSFSLHPSATLLEQFGQLADRIDRIATEYFGRAAPTRATRDYY